MKRQNAEWIFKVITPFLLTFKVTKVIWLSEPLRFKDLNSLLNVFSIRKCFEAVNSGSGCYIAINI
jgi:hypothetical protein